MQTQQAILTFILYTGALIFRMDTIKSRQSNKMNVVSVWNSKHFHIWRVSATSESGFGSVSGSYGCVSIRPAGSVSDSPSHVCTSLASVRTPSVIHKVSVLLKSSVLLYHMQQQQQQQPDLEVKCNYRAVPILYFHLWYDTDGSVFNMS